MSHPSDVYRAALKALDGAREAVKRYVKAICDTALLVRDGNWRHLNLGGHGLPCPGVGAPGPPLCLTEIPDRHRLAQAVAAYFQARAVAESEYNRLPQQFLGAVEKPEDHY